MWILLITIIIGGILLFVFGDCKKISKQIQASLSYVVYSPNNYPSLLTIFQCFPIRIGKTYKETLRNIFGSRKKLSTSYEMHFGLHSDTKEDQSRAIAKCYKYYGTIVVECTIPRFSLYWIGDNNDIVSNKLKYVKIL